MTATHIVVTVTDANRRPVEQAVFHDPTRAALFIRSRTWTGTRREPCHCGRASR